MRAFIAIDLDEPIRRQIAEVQATLSRRLPTVRWVPPERMHLTLAFLGEIDDSMAAAVAAALRAWGDRQSAFEIEIAGLGAFPERGPARVIWLGINDATGRLAACHAACESAIEELGIARETRPFAPHLTLARIKEPRLGWDVRNVVVSVAAPRTGVMRVGGVTFYESTLARAGPRYEAIDRANFGG
jgi:2'-5' RNA ligase